MPIDFRTYAINNVTVCLIPSICTDRLVVYSANRTNGTGWAIRDFLTNRILDNEHSNRVRQDIEREIDGSHSEYPPFYNVDEAGHPARWELYLTLRTSAYHRHRSTSFDRTLPASAPGDTWVPIMPEPGWQPVQL